MYCVEFKESHFGIITDNSEKERLIKLFTWENKNISVEVITYGATIRSIKIPDKNGVIADIVIGFNNIEGYQNPLNRYFGATIGRVANRIKNGKINIDNAPFSLFINHEAHHLHGGLKGFDKVVWEHYVDGKKLILSYHSADLEEGYPGDLVVHTIFELTNTNQFLVEFKATTTKPTVVNLTNHSYFNLAGHNKGPAELYKHVVSINADRITDVDGKLLPVADTVFDLRIPKILGDIIKKVPNSDGFDHNFCITKGPEQGNTFVARLYHPDSGRVLEVYSNQPGVQFYTSNYFPENPNTYTGDKKGLKILTGKDGNYYKHGALCFETQNWPDAPNHKNFPKSILFPGETYYHYVAYKFSVNN
ncbi:aldose 1-epimerase-like [Asbolus verrucosus]|uniref:Aldose 1-epimerase n=1 Tax=Asbolus verrucosus TaxID=1661398 RepID=A0A482VAM7_ASBVE|nr:aldose 1-epimerase-like [Asbolus verrucosus]